MKKDGVAWFVDTSEKDLIQKNGNTLRLKTTVINVKYICVMENVLKDTYTCQMLISLAFRTCYLHAIMIILDFSQLKKL